MDDMRLMDYLCELGRRARITEDMQFDPLVDLEIITAFEKDRPSKLKVKPAPVPLYRCYFIEDSTVFTYMTHLLRGEYDIFARIVGSPPTHTKSIQLITLTNNDVVLKQTIDASTLAHLLFRFNHRIAKKYIGEERFLY